MTGRPKKESWVENVCASMCFKSEGARERGTEEKIVFPSFKNVDRSEEDGTVHIFSKQARAKWREERMLGKCEILELESPKGRWNCWL